MMSLLSVEQTENIFPSLSFASLGSGNKSLIFVSGAEVFSF